jgi:CHASE2 domain-containing sensor protein
MSHAEHQPRHPKKKKKFYSRFTKYLIERDTFLATLWVFIFIFGLGALPISLGFFNPIKIALKDFDYNDLTYSKLGKSLIGNTKSDKFDSRIKIVNIGMADRQTLAMIIDKVASYQPKVMALDALFFEAKDSVQDAVLAETFSRHKNLVIAQKLDLAGKEGDSITTSGNYFKTAGVYGYANFFNDEKSTTRYFNPVLADYKGQKYDAFAPAIVKMYETESYKKIAQKVNKEVLINYTRSTLQYQPIEIDLLMNDGVSGADLKDKIVLFGYLNWPNPSDPNSYNPYDILDKKFTPMNPQFAGKSVPDMNGIVVHANIISMILDKNYVKKVPSWVNYLIAFAVCWLFMSFFIHYYLEAHIWFHLVAKIAQVAALLLFTFIGIYMYDKYRLKVDMKLSLIVIIMCVDVIYFYEAWAVWMHKKFNYQTVFKPHHH